MIMVSVHKLVPVHRGQGETEEKKQNTPEW